MIKLPRYHWIVEMNGYGHAYRKWLEIPNWAPLPFYGDHGVLTAGYLAEHELVQKTNLFFTFSKKRFEALNPQYKQFKIIRCPSPWVMYRQKKGIKLSSNASGTLIFIPKSLPEYKFKFSVSDYLEKIVTSKEFEAPYTFILHHHDRGSLIEDKLKKYKYKIISFGSDSFYSNIIDNFYATVSKYAFAVSAFPGSELFYTHELGLSFTKIQIDIEGVPLSDKLRNVFDLQVMDKCSQEARIAINNLFSDDVNHDRIKQDLWINEMLSLDLANLENTAYFRSLVFKEFLPQLPNYIKSISGRALSRLNLSK
jgi:hypothetical protein